VTSDADQRRQVLDRYFTALPAHDWSALAETISDERLHRVGPFGDVVDGKAAYLEYLSAVLPTLKSYRLEVTRVRWLVDGGAVVELTEHVEMDGQVQRYPEALFFDFDASNRIAEVAIYLQQLGTDAGQAAVKRPGRAGR
jgi:hypothetical protein